MGCDSHFWLTHRSGPRRIMGCQSQFTCPESGNYERSFIAAVAASAQHRAAAVRHWPAIPAGLTYEARMDSPQRLNHHLADTQVLNTSAE
jgi:hypothetical protein